MRDVGYICWCTASMSSLLLLYCVLAFFLFLLCTAHQALVYTRGSRLISISLLLLSTGLAAPKTKQDSKKLKCYKNAFAAHPGNDVA